MYEEPYRWIEAVANRRQYVDDQIIQGHPLVGVSFSQGILLVTFNRGTSKIYEIYDRIALGGMGHPTDLEKLRFTLLDMAHVEGFQRSPADVTASRLMKSSLAPAIKEAFEEIFKAPYIAKILLAEVGSTQDRDRLLSINYDGMFEEQSGFGMVAASKSIREVLRSEAKQTGPLTSLKETLEFSLRLWGISSLLQEPSTALSTEEEPESIAPQGSLPTRLPGDEEILTRICDSIATETLECVLLDRESGKMETYRSLSVKELQPMLPHLFPAST